MFTSVQASLFNDKMTSVTLVQASLFNDIWRLLTTLQAPFLKVKKGVRFSTLYCWKKRNLLVYDHSHQQTSCFSHARSVIKWINPMFDDYFESSTVDRLVPPAPAAKAPVNPTGPSVSIPIDQEAPSRSHSPSSSDHQSSSVHQGVAAEHLFENSEASSSGVIAITQSNQTTQPHEHLQKWTASHPTDNIIGNPSRPVSTRKQLATNALWCIYNSVLSKVEPKNFKSVVTEDCWFQAIQDEIHEFDRLDIWKLVPPPDCAMIIALKWIYKVKLDEYGDVLKNKACLVAKGY
ncbi:retrovirus-related pol polyprotein from transposon TNT 1-94 [Tanacetum coccineum]